jgi:hypothetical protein
MEQDLNPFFLPFYPNRIIPVIVPIFVVLNIYKESRTSQ